MGRSAREPAWVRRGSAGGLSAAFLLIWAAVTLVAATFPTLTGRVVDQAQIIDARSRPPIEQKLTELESKSGIQLVVATVTSLEGQDIESYANQLFRT